MKWKHPRNSGDDNDVTKIISLSKPKNTDVDGNKLYFYSDVNVESIETLNRQIDEVSKQSKLIQFTYSLPEAPPIEIHICSDGGDVFAGIAAVDKIINNKVPIHTYCEGIVASAATLISTVGHKRFITKNSCMMIHQVSSGLWGNYAEFKDEVKNLDLLMEAIKNVYSKHTKLDSSILDELLKHDLYAPAEVCLNYGLVDEIL